MWSWKDAAGEGSEKVRNVQLETERRRTLAIERQGPLLLLCGKKAMSDKVGYLAKEMYK